MKSVLIGIVVSLAVAFAAHAAYNNLTAGNDKQVPATQAAQSAPVAVVAQQETTKPVNTTANTAAATGSWKKANTSLLAAAPQAPARTVAAQPVNVVTVEKPAAPAEKAEVKAATPQEEEQAATTVKTVNQTVASPALNQTVSAQETSFDNPGSIAEYDFAFVDPQAITDDPMTNISAANEQAVQNVYEETVLSPSAPRN